MNELMEIIFIKSKLVYSVLNFFSLLGLSYFISSMVGGIPDNFGLLCSMAVFSTLTSALFIANQLHDKKCH